MFFSQSSSSPSVAIIPIFSLNSNQSMMKCFKLRMLVARYSTCNIEIIYHSCEGSLTSWLKSSSTQLGLSW